ncbi:MAG: cytochrome c biogenesis protein CcdA [Actinobacteria bacterium HGW-Actinobacteria-5]|jgi:cytochrome c biogenesis protein CcdA|nr:MAG: cytochrome c biogenesis protein CcdA [Actinobacteria bacterium HGW-Actinobacteria-5]
MGDLLTTGGILAAFFAGGVALFAPCCIVFLAPSYLAGAVKNRRWRLLPLTFLFAAGLAVVLVPITVGVSLIAAAIAKYHSVLYWAGGILMLVLAGFTLFGRMWSLPNFLRAPDTARGDGASFFALGVFSGIASSCCAPVLVGVMTLSALAGNPAGGVALGLAYVFGMVFPLFVMALVWDATGLRNKPLVAKPVRLRLGRWTLATNTVNLAVAIGFAIMGVFIIYLANTGQMTSGPDVQVAIGRRLATWFAQIETWLQPVPEPILGVGLLLVAGVFVWGTLVGRRRVRRPADNASTEPDEAPSLSRPSDTEPVNH